MKVKLFASLWLLSSALLPGQTSSPGTLSGRVTDSRGDGIENVIVILTDSAGTSQRVATSADGSFKVAPLTPGSYRIEVESGGVKRAGRQEVMISSNAGSQIEVRFNDEGVSRSGTMQQGTVDVEATSPTIQTDSAEVSRSYGTRIVRSLPLSDRQYQDLVTLMPGVTPPTVFGDRITNPQRTRIYNVNGQPAFSNAQFQDGAYNTDSFTGLPLRIQSNESVQALDIRTSNYNAEYGYAGGSWANTVTRPGTNGFHGGVFFFNSNSFFTARNPLNPGDHPAPRFNLNQFGGNAGGPIVPDRLYVFANYEGFLQRGNQLRFETVPTAALRGGDFSQFSTPIYNPLTGIQSGNNAGAGRLPFPNNRIPASQFNPVSTALLAGLPLPNQSGLTNNLVGNAMLLDDNHRFDGKLDHRFSDSTTGFLRYGFTQGSVDRGSLLGNLGDAATASMRSHSAVASVSTNFSSTMLAEFRFGYGRFRNGIGPSGDASALNSQLAGFGFTGGLPLVNIAGFSSLGLPGNFPSKAINNTYNASTNWMAHTGMHRLRFGVDVHWADASGFNPGWYGQRGGFEFGGFGTASPAALAAGDPFNLQANAFASFLTGAPTVAGMSSFAEVPTFHQTRLAGYITDTINLWSKAHLELGVRYDIYSPIRTRRDSASGFFDPTTGAFETGDFDKIDYNNIAPRVGLVIQPVQRLAIRAGYALQYFPTPFALAPLNQVQMGGQSGLIGGFATVPFQPVQVSGNGVPNLPFYTTTADPRTPYFQTYSAMIQADMTHGFLLDIGYTGSLGRQLPYQRTLTAAQPGTGIAGLPFNSLDRTAAVYERANGLNSNYNSAQVNLTKRFGVGLALAASYTYGRAMDYGFNLLNPFSRPANYAPADWDRQHILAASHVWQLPFGAGSRYFTDGTAARLLGNWEINGILRWATGTPYTVTASPLACACPGLAFIPATASGPVEINGSSSFDPSLFDVPSPGSFGDIGRNSIRGPDLFNYDLALFRNFAITENMKLELRGEAYNITNSTNYALPISNVNQPGFGRSLSLFNGMGGRRFQVGGRFLF